MSILPDGSVWKSLGVPSSSKPAIRAEIPKGRLPLDWVYFCLSCAINLVIYSRVTGSSTVNLWLWHSTRALSIRILASAVKPIKRKQVSEYKCWNVMKTYRRMPWQRDRLEDISCAQSAPLAIWPQTSFRRPKPQHLCRERRQQSNLFLLLLERTLLERDDHRVRIQWWRGRIGSRTLFKTIGSVRSDN